MEIDSQTQNELYIQHLRQERMRSLIMIIIIASLVWGFVGSVDLLIISSIQSIFPTKSKIQYAVLQIFIYVLLLFLIIYITDIDASNLFMPSNHFKLSERISSRK